ncbi:MAG: dihydropteroate synthase, partial [Alistipes sp.]|nr:dihydropteroate synthase [Alistipes sp.]
MAILNITPDSFYAGSRMPAREDVERRLRECVAQGADLIDIGGYSSRPGAAEVSPDEEWRRVELGLSAVRRLAPGMPVSVDTFRASVVERAVGTFGEVIVNDISAGELDPAMIPTVARHGLTYVAMHMKGDPRTMQALADYRPDIVSEVCDYFRRRVDLLTAAGIRPGRIILDPGFGFAKTAEQNY